MSCTPSISGTPCQRGDLQDRTSGPQIWPLLLSGSTPGPPIWYLLPSHLTLPSVSHSCLAPTSSSGTCSHLTRPSYPNLAPTPIWPDTSHPSWDFCFDVHFNITSNGFNLPCSPPHKFFFYHAWKKSQNYHEATPFPSIRYLYESPHMPETSNLPHYHQFSSNGCYLKWLMRSAHQEWSIKVPFTQNEILSFPNFLCFPRFILFSPHMGSISLHMFHAKIISFTSYGKIPKIVMKQPYLHQ